MKMISITLRSVIPLTFILSAYGISLAGTNFCSWTKSQCNKNEFPCLNGKCLVRAVYCDDKDDCGDNSDERFCDYTLETTHSCPENFIRCEGFVECIPAIWKCDGHQDCPDGVDENNCEKRGPANMNRSEADTARTNQAEQTKIAVNNVKRWLNDQRQVLNSTENWGIDVGILALIGHLSDNTFSASFLNKAEMAYELKIQLLSRLSSMKLEDIPSTELASYVNAFLVMCINPRNFYGHNIIQELRNKVVTEKYTNPYVILSLCNAGESFTMNDDEKTTKIFIGKHRKIWTSTQAVVVMALACFSKQPEKKVNIQSLRGMTLELKKQQSRNGTVVDLPTTALVMQALISMDSESDPDKFDELKAFQELLRNQKPDGSFGDVMNTLLVTPVLTCKSLADINSSHCQYESRTAKSALEMLSRIRGPKIRVQYSIWIGKEKDLERNFILRVPQHISLYGFMEIAADVDFRFKVEYSVRFSQPYVTAISGMRDNVLTGKFCFLYVIQDGKPTLSIESPADIKLKDNGHYVMWYRRGTWIE